MERTLGPLSFSTVMAPYRQCVRFGQGALPMDPSHAPKTRSVGSYECGIMRDSTKAAVAIRLDTYLVRRPVLIHAKGDGCSELGSVTSTSCCLGRSRALSFFTRWYLYSAVKVLASCENRPKGVPVTT